jgi:acyl-CoA synthetase (AMP-forming)/AMP-acid ligase II
VRPDTVVAWQMPTRVETAVLQLALARLGVVQVALIHMYREREVGYILQSTKTNILVVPGVWRGFDYGAMAETLKTDQTHPEAVLDVQAGLPLGDTNSLPGFHPAQEARYVYSTSGTTANPKAVLHTDGSLIAAGASFADALGITDHDVNALAFPFGHVGGPVHLTGCLRHGIPCVYLESFSIPESIAVLRDHGVTITGGTSAHFVMLLEEQRQRSGEKLVPTLRLLYGGGASKPPEIYRRVKTELGVEILYGFGLTEAPVVTCCSTEDTEEQRTFTDGAPLPICEVRIVDDEDRVVPIDEEGEILVRGDQVAKGYTDSGLMTAFTPEGFLRTGDRGRMREDGHLVITGRSKEIIIRKGENISAREIEDVLVAHPNIAAVAVIGLPDESRGEQVCAVVECRAGSDPPTLPEIQEICHGAGLMVQKWPERLEIVDALPRNATLKVMKDQLRRVLASSP